MRLCVTCVYWTLLLVSVVSSGLLFLIVASEGTQVSGRPKGISKEDNTPADDVSGETPGGGDFPSSEPRIPDAHPRPTVKTEQEHLHSEENHGKPSSQEILWRESEIEKNVDVLKESLTQQPNLSQGISETGQAVVLTLVDTAAAELQSLAEPRLTAEIRSRTSVKNASLTTAASSSASATTRSITASTTSTTTTTTATASTSTVARGTEEEDRVVDHEPKEKSSGDLPGVLMSEDSSNNFTEVEPTEDELVVTLNDGQQSENEIVEQYDEVVTVRAEQKIVKDSSTTRIQDEKQLQDDEVKEDTIKQEENLTASPELDDGAARARLVGGGAEEAAAAILDGLVTTSGPTDHHHEDIPSFSEWAQKRLEEAEKKKTHPNASIQNPGGLGRGVGGMKVRSKNYASPDCGAKIVAVNPEARSARSVLVSTRDEYMLNTCTSRVWFVVELCEAIQAKKIELANFELFSSSPKDFSVYVSDRFPTREWSPVGQFTAKDQRDIQSFALHPQLFGKFIKVELHSHYGSEHFCPISLFRAYGTSEFEVLETETDHQESEDDDDDDEDDEDDPLDSEAGADSRNLFGSARDAVLRIVKKAAEVLVKTGDPTNKNNITKIQESIEDNIVESSSFASCMTPRYTINCANCTDDRFAGVFQLLSCRAGHLDTLLEIPFVSSTLKSGEICGFLGVDIGQASPHEANGNVVVSSRILPLSDDEESSRSSFSLMRNLRVNFLTSIFSPEYLVALCNVIATKDRELVLNTSYEIVGNASVNSSTRIDAHSNKFESLDSANSAGQARVSASSCSADGDSGACKNSAMTNRETKASRAPGPSTREQDTLPTANPQETTAATNSETLLATQIKPTKTLSREDMRRESSAPVLEANGETNEETAQAELLTTPSPTLNLPAATTRTLEEPNLETKAAESTTQTLMTPLVTVTNLPTREPLDATNAQHDLSHDATAASKRLLENNEQEIKHAKQESGEQEAKFIAQEQISLDSILSDLKDLEGDPATGIHAHGGHSNNVVAQPTASNAPQQKESVFLRLSNRIKALERNMSLSGQYLEELSKRYKKQVEEMQRSLERATAAMSEESRKGEERELRRLEEISSLREEISSLTQSMELLLYDRNSWRSKFSTICQHFALIVVEIVVLIVVVSYCRRSSDFEDGEDSRNALEEEEATRRRSAGAMSTISPSKKVHKRRPSEIASRIAGTYGDLMIDDRNAQESKKEKKKRRKRELNGRTTINGEKESSRTEEGMPGGTALPSRRSSSIDTPSNHAKQLELSQTRKRPDSAPEYSGGWFSSNDKYSLSNKEVDGAENEAGKKSRQEKRSPDETSQAKWSADEERRNREEQEEKSTSLFRGGGILKAAKLSSPSFMKTALGSRSKRNAKGGKGDQGAQLKSDNWEWYSRNSGNRSDGGSPGSSRAAAAGSSSDSPSTGAGTTNGHHRNPSDESGSCSSATNIPGSKKTKKTTGGLRKMAA